LSVARNDGKIVKQWYVLKRIRAHKIGEIKLVRLIG